MKGVLYKGIVFFLILFFAVPAGRADELEEGKKLFKVKCHICHTANDPFEASFGSFEIFRVKYQGRNGGRLLLVENRFGPDLRGVFNAPAGRRAKEGFVHSPAFMKAAPDIVWTEENLDKWLTKTWKFIPGTWMYLRVPDPKERRKIITFLKQYR